MTNSTKLYNLLMYTNVTLDEAVHLVPMGADQANGILILANAANEGMAGEDMFFILDEEEDYMASLEG